MEIKLPDMNGGNAALRAIIRRQAREIATLGDHLAQMGQYMTAMMKAHHDVMTLAWRQHKELDLVINPQVMEARKTLKAITDIAAPHADQYKKMVDPSFTGEKLVAMQRNAAKAEPETKADIPANSPRAKIEGTQLDKNGHN